MTNRRVVLGALGAGETLPGLGRRLRDAGAEVVFVGGRQSAEQLVRTAVAEDVDRIVVPADDVPAVESMLVELHVDGVAVGCDEPDAPEPPMNG